MILRVRIKWNSNGKPMKKNGKVNLEINATLQELKTQIDGVGGDEISVDWLTSFLSLNGKDAIVLTSGKVVDAGIAPGDLVFVVVGSSTPTPTPTTTTSTVAPNTTTTTTTTTATAANPNPSSLSHHSRVEKRENCAEAALERFNPQPTTNNIVETQNIFVQPMDCDLNHQQQHGQQVQLTSMEQTVMDELQSMSWNNKATSTSAKHNVAVFALVKAMLSNAGFDAQKPNASGFSTQYNVVPFLPSWCCLVSAVAFGSSALLINVSLQCDKEKPPPVITANIKTKSFKINTDAQTFSAIFQSPNLFLKLKDVLINPLLNLARTTAGLTEIHCLAALIPELKSLIFKFLSPKELCCLACVSKDFKVVSSHNSIWFPLFRQIENIGPNPDPNGSDWKLLYRHHVEKHKQTFRDSNRFPPGFMGSPMLPMAPRYPMIPHPDANGGVGGIIGGGYDLNPQLPNNPFQMGRGRGRGRGLPRFGF